MRRLGEIIKDYRSVNEISLRDFAKLCCISHSYIDRLEKGTDPRSGAPVEPTLDIYIKVSQAMNMPLENLLTETGYINKNSENSNISNPSFDLSILYNNNKETLTKKDLEIISKNLKNFVENIKNNEKMGAAAFDGEITDEDLSKLEDAMLDVYTDLRKINKEKYTPKKYKKDANK